MTFESRTSTGLVLAFGIRQGLPGLVLCVGHFYCGNEPDRLLCASFSTALHMILSHQIRILREKWSVEIQHNGIIAVASDKAMLSGNVASSVQTCIEHKGDIESVRNLEWFLTTERWRQWNGRHNFRTIARSVPPNSRAQWKAQRLIARDRRLSCILLWNDFAHIVGQLEARAECATHWYYRVL